MDKLEFCCNCKNLEVNNEKLKCNKLEKNIESKLTECQESFYFELDVDSIPWYQKLVTNFRYNEKFSKKGLVVLEKYVILLNEIEKNDINFEFVQNNLSDLFFEFVILCNELGFDLKEIMENGLKRNDDVKSRF